ncbi:endonuclease/exonuclease/phosphatase family protein [Haloactinopolyspora sp.]|uniref:endonuclease/exonuclease/phosphatase family protein n=1 Tax=Haloactinopolyspora sp. TaxID=1966353 RepID=UPI002621C779|nr:endonuclease/exonuclease/phosphatase family protein [Haloactinopolyspora sp.]
MTAPVTRLRVLSYNIHGLRDDAHAVARVLRAADADVVCLQEAPKFLAWRGRCAALARRSDLLYAGGGGTTGGTALFTSIRVDVREVQEHQLRRTPGLTKRGVVIARLAKNGVEFSAASIHLGLDPAERARHLTDITGLVNRLGLATTVIAGDINEKPDAMTWARLVTQYTDAAAGDDTPTFSATNPRRKIDGIFVRGGIEVESARVVDSPDVRAASDHRPVVADLVLTG